MFSWRQRVFDHIFYEEVGPDLVKRNAEVIGFGIGEHDKLHLGRRFIVVEFVFAGAVRYKAEVESISKRSKRLW
jgi:hypothetical protein